MDVTRKKLGNSGLVDAGLVGDYEKGHDDGVDEMSIFPHMILRMKMLLPHCSRSRRPCQEARGLQ